IANQTTAVGTAVGPLAFTVGDLETAAGSLTVTSASSNLTLVLAANIALGGSGAARTVTVTPAAGQTGVATITLTVSDTLATTNTSFQLTVTATPAGLLAAYAFNETSGTATLDGSGNGNAGTLTNGAAFAAGKNGNAVSLDGVNDFVNLGNPTSLRLTGSMTLSAWINAQTFPFDDATIVSKRSNGEVGFQLDTTIDRGPRTIGLKLTSASGSNVFRYGATSLQLNTWYHIAGVYNAATQTLNVYLNGQLDNGLLLGTVTTTQQNSTQKVHIGQRPGMPGTYNFAGKIDDVRLYNRALTQSEIQADMTMPVAGAPSDTTPPSVVITAPTAGSSVFNLVSVVADASDNVAIGGVQFQLDGQPLGEEVTSAPYSVLWNAGGTHAGSHVLTAVARDIAGNVTASAPVSVVVTAATPDLVGQWAAPVTWPLVAVHAH
ncbi:MAG: LamG-like jellyroll fold domain-containing protein, partial [Gammaproteobacteria bacterium]